MDENNVKSSALSELELLQQQKLKLEIKEQRHWLIKMLAPYVAAVVTIIGLLLTYVHERNAERNQADAERSRLVNERAADQAQADRFVKQLQQNEEIARHSREQIEKDHQEELFVQAISQLGATAPMQRVAAVYAISEFAEQKHFRRSAVAALAALLKHDTDPSTDEALYKAFDSAGTDGLQALVTANRAAQNVLARSYGAYVGLELGHKFPNALDSYPDSTQEKAYKEFERQIVIGDPVATVYYHHRPLEDVLSHDFIRDAFWLQSFPETQQEVFNGAKNGAWKYPPKDYGSARKEALDGLTDSARYLELTSSILEKLLREHSGRVAGWALDGVYLVVSDLRGLDLHGIRLEHSDLEMADLRNANLSNAVCRGTNFDGSNFSHAHLVGTVLVGANLNQVQPFPIDTPHGRTFTYTAPGTSEDLRFNQADFTRSSWRQASSISGPLRRYLEARF